MEIPNIEQLDEIRKTGLRPQIVGCFIYQDKVLMVYNHQYDIWQFPQGGIANQESPDEALIREMREELGDKFIGTINKYSLFAEDSIKFPPNKYNVKELKTDDGKNRFMVGKKYLFFAVWTGSNVIDVNTTHFDKYQWLDYPTATQLAETIHQPGKKRITLNTLNLLKNLEYIHS